MIRHFVFFTYLCLLFSSSAVLAEQPRLRLAAILPLTGIGSFYGEEISWGIELCHDDSMVKVLLEDSKSKPMEGVTAFQRLFAKNSVDIVIVSLSSVSSAVLPIAKAQNFPIIFTVSAASGLAEKGGPSAFRYTPPADDEAPVMAKYAREQLKAKTSAVIYVEDDYGESFKEVFSEVFSGLGGTVLSSTSFTHDEKDFRTRLLRIKRSKPDVLYIAGFEIHTRAIIRQARELRLNTVFIANQAIASAHIVSQDKQNLEGVYLAIADFHHSKRKEVQQFKAEYHKRFGRQPGHHAAIACDTINILEEIAGKGNENITAGLQKIDNHSSLMGVISVDSFGEVHVPLLPGRIRSGEFVVLE